MNVSIAEPERLGRTELPDGRSLGWAEWGPTGGAPVLLCPGAATSRWLGFGADVLDELGVRLVSADRPGLGASDPAPGRTLEDWADDVRHLAVDRRLDGLAVVGYSQGAPFALACAAAGLATSAAIVSGTDELAAPGFADALIPQVRGMVEAVAGDPAAAEASFAGFGDPETMWQIAIAGASAVDREVYLQPPFEQAYRRAMAEAFSQGPAGYARDTVLASGRWPFDPADVTVPVDLWYGPHDTSPVHSPDLGATLARRIPAARRHVVSGAGGSLLWTHSAEILRSLLRGAAGA
ncbi:alpha/beta fold hydrolase [Planomonospora parontospora]|uniref:alpha/beta fold hydrolase n=1 Tax=Planomonospora parontospora TaxID=58119 RepID=UPI00167006A8|nr:alpha/beta hydrolase [Planomonospora parontospora]GGL16131.1 alpha/beta hydrolase [Planomonospora parontospora subsp. antibiotica]GII15406.1 alpha/beta hydrolase [Planomonospora parontospora subsp. antibiotica]